MLNYKVNNFDFLRFFAACIVIITHSINLSNTSGSDPFALLTKGQESLGGLAVSIFFVISGYLICASYIRHDNVIKYLYARVLRIFPALIVLMLLTVLIVGPIVSKLSAKEYFSNALTYEYFRGLLLFPMSYILPGVKFSNGAFGTAINGSLWTLSFEFLCYFIVAGLGVLKLLNRYVVLTIWIFLLLIFYNIDYIIPNAKTINILPYINIYYFIKLTSLFFSGMLCFFYKEFLIRNKNKLFDFGVLLGSIIILGVASYFGSEYQFYFSIFGTYIIFYVAYSNKIKFYNFAKYGDFSYGIYIYGFLVQQLVVKSFGGQMDYNANWIISIPISIFLGYCSWNLIEKHFTSRVKIGKK